RARRLLTKAHERLDETGEAKLLGLLETGDPRGEVRMTWHAKEVIRSIYDIEDPDLAREFVTELAGDLQDDSHPPEVRSLGRTLGRWLDHIVAWHEAKVTNGPTEAIILWSLPERVVDVHDEGIPSRRGRVLWSASLMSTTSLAA
ncbi:MAG: transposase, partial [Actinomycetota bacterium]